VLAWIEAELAQKEDLVGQSLAGSSVSGTDTGVDLPRPRAGFSEKTLAAMARAW
jgi:hypothetical protein